MMKMGTLTQAPLFFFAAVLLSQQAYAAPTCNCSHICDSTMLAAGEYATKVNILEYLGVEDGMIYYRTRFRKNFVDPTETFYQDAVATYEVCPAAFTVGDVYVIGGTMTPYSGSISKLQDVGDLPIMTVSVCDLNIHWDTMTNSQSNLIKNGKDECYVNPCQNGGTCTVADTDTCYECECPPDISGDNCEEVPTGCDLDPCLNGGTCTDVADSYTCTCTSGFTGEVCDEVVSGCDLDPCLNGGTCADVGDSYTCTCPHGYTGDNCENLATGCDLDPCLNGGTCTDVGNSYTCTCPHGYTGDDCDEVATGCDLDPCLNGGTCTDVGNSYTCTCPHGYTGDDCEQIVSGCDLDPCLNGGTCADVGDSYTCTCPHGYTGDNCENLATGCDLDPCLNGGTCTDVGNSYTCTCPHGYTGDDCDEVATGCDLDPCLNGGTCTDVGNSYTCTCPHGYTGDDCEQTTHGCDRDPCLNGGTCADFAHIYYCTCPHGYTGDNCELLSTGCDLDPCLNGGTCTDVGDSYTCTCPHGYTGDDCDELATGCDLDPCLNGGTCTDVGDSYTCTCPHGYTGDDCDELATGCDLDPCLNGGTCTDVGDSYTCTCPHGYTGDDCDEVATGCDLDPCLNGGTCTDVGDSYTCTCPHGYTGDNCDELATGCDLDPCLNGGTCTDVGDSYTCTCPHGYTGDDCDELATGCDLDPCLNGGTCTDVGDSYTCTCPHGYTGDDCDEVATGCDLDPCLNGGTCTDVGDSFTCTCPHGYTGDDCDELATGCDLDPCLNGGSCTGVGDDYACTCSPGYTGQDCDEVIGACESNPCSDGIACIEDGDSYTCSCPLGLAGDDCCKGSCASAWEMVYSHTSDGVATFGSKEDLIDAVMSGTQVKVFTPSLGPDGYQTSVENVQVKSGEVCVQSLFAIGADGFTFETTGYYDFHSFCTTGGVSNSKWEVGQFNNIGSENSNLPVQWFVRRYPPAIYSGTSTGSIATGSPSNVVEAVKSGAEILVYYNDHSIKTDSMEISADETGAYGQSVWRVWTNIENGYQQFKMKGCRTFSVYSPDGSIDYDKWQISNHYLKRPDHSNNDIDWYANWCWKVAYSHDEDGNAIAGSLSGLYDAVTAGHKVRILIGNTLYEPDQIMLRNNHLNAVILSALTKADIATMSTDVAWDWKVASTTGTLSTLNILYGSSTIEGQSTSKAAMTWFTDLSQWDSVLVNDADGNTISGSTQSLVDDIKNGADVRYVLDYTSDDYKVVLQADNLQIATDGNVGAMHVLAVCMKLTPGSDTEMTFTDTPQWWFTIAVTDGQLSQSIWKVGEQVSVDSKQVFKGTMKWFTSTGSPSAEADNVCEVATGCDLDPCLNGGTCTDVGDSYTCTCPNGYTGDNCDELVTGCDLDPCLNGGTCTDVGDSYTCACPYGFTGDDCDEHATGCDLDPCLNGGTCTDAADSYTCTCALGYTGEYCGEISCSSAWEKVYAHTSEGVATYGSKQDLVDAFESGAEVKVFVPSMGPDGYQTSVQMISSEDDVICVEALFSVGASDFAFNTTGYYDFHSFCTNGGSSVSKWKVGVHEEVGRESTSLPVQWFVRQYPPSIYSASSTAVVKSGTPNNVAEAVKSGAEILIYYSGYSIKMDNIELSEDGTEAYGQALWRVTPGWQGGLITFAKRGYRVFSVLSPDGTVDFDKWSISEHVSTVNKTMQRGIDWYANWCWKVAYSHDEDGNTIAGSLSGLYNAVSAGQRVRILIGNTLYEPDQIMLRNNHLNAVILSAMTKDDIGSMSANLAWDWKVVSTTGTLSKLNILYGSSTKTERSTSKAAMTWFIDIRQWDSVRVNDQRGYAVSGSKSTQNLVDDVKNGTDVRYVLDYTSDDYKVVLQADNLQIATDGTVGAMHVRAVSMDFTPGSDTEMTFRDPPQWWFTIAVTDGRLAQSNWKVGKQVSIANDEFFTGTMEWFTSVDE